MELLCRENGDSSQQWGGVGAGQEESWLRTMGTIAQRSRFVASDA